ncbi:MAG: NUDIX domain-containing protein [Patescibacteria group bacterium]|jgi:8-oxo-dGTP diphosphatase
MQESQHYCVTDIFLENEDGEILMIKRSKNKEILPNVYNGLGGKIHTGETPLESVLREANEEGGIVNASGVKLRANLTVKDKFGFWQIYIFYGHIAKDSVVIREIDEGTLEWVPKDELTKYYLVPDLMHWFPKMITEPDTFQFVNVEYDDQYKIINIKIESLN